MRIHIFIPILVALIVGCQVPKSVYPIGYKKSQMSVEEYPFQVLHAESVLSDLNNSRVTRFDFVKTNDKLQLNNGHLILVHHSGKFAEFNGGAIVDIDSLDSSFYKFNSQIEARNERRPDLTMLLGWYQHGLGCVANSSYIEILGGNDINRAEPFLCLEWLTSSPMSNEFTLTLRNIYDQIILEKNVDGTSVSMDLTDKMELFTGGLIVLQVVHKSDQEVSSEYKGIMIDGSRGYSPQYCIDVSALNSLEAGCHQIWKEAHHAQYFFENAAQLSDKPFYKEMLRLGQTTH